VSGIVAPEPRVMVTVLGLTTDHVRLVDARRTRSAPDTVRVELGEVHLTGDLHTMALVIARVAEGLTEIEAARRPPVRRDPMSGPQEPGGEGAALPSQPTPSPSVSRP
jgi:hypothetical protein